MMSHREPPATISLSYTLNLGNLSNNSIIIIVFIYFSLFISFFLMWD
jgi:hypothetical protein